VPLEFGSSISDRSGEYPSTDEHFDIPNSVMPVPMQQRDDHLGSQALVDNSRIIRFAELQPVLLSKKENSAKERRDALQISVEGR